MPRGVKNATETVQAVNGAEYDRITPGFEDEDDELTIEHEGRYKVITPRAVNFNAYGVRFVEGIGRTDDSALAHKLEAEFHYKVVDTQKAQTRPIPIPEPLSETT